MSSLSSVMRLRAGCALCVLLTAGGSISARAQNITIPGSADASRIEENAAPMVTPPSGLERDTTRQRAVPQVPEGAEALRFILQSLQIDGMTAYTEQDVRRLYAQYIGTEISVATLFDIMAALQNKYLDDGYALTKVVIPNQNIEAGHAQLQVIEGYVAQVEMDESLRDNAVIQDGVKRITAMKPLNTKTLERLLLIFNDLPDKAVGAILASATDENLEPGAVRLVLQESAERDVRGRIGINNDGSVFTGPFSVTAMGRVYNMGLANSTLEVNGSQTTSIQEQSYGGVSYAMPIIGASGARVTAAFSMARTEPGSTLDRLDVKGASRNITLGVSYPVIKERAKTCIIDIEFDVRDSRTKILNDEFYDDRLRVVRAGVNYSFSDTWNGINMFDVHASQGLDILGARETGSINLSRAAGRSDFRKLTFFAGRLQALPHDFEFYALASGQYSNDPLLSAEEFGFGGGAMGRGYDPSELTGDRGMSALFELHHRSTPRLFNLDLILQPYVFFDIGKVWNIDNADTTHASGASAGMGFKINIENQWDANFGLAFPLTRPADNMPKYTDEYGPRVLFSLSRQF